MLATCAIAILCAPTFVVLVLLCWCGAVKDRVGNGFADGEGFKQEWASDLHQPAPPPTSRDQAEQRNDAPLHSTTREHASAALRPRPGWRRLTVLLSPRSPVLARTSFACTIAPEAPPRCSTRRRSVSRVAAAWPRGGGIPSCAATRPENRIMTVLESNIVEKKVVGLRWLEIDWRLRSWNFMGETSCCEMLFVSRSAGSRLRLLFVSR